MLDTRTPDGLREPKSKRRRTSIKIWRVRIASVEIRTDANTRYGRQSQISRSQNPSLKCLHGHRRDLPDSFILRLFHF